MFKVYLKEWKHIFLDASMYNVKCELCGQTSYKRQQLFTIYEHLVSERKDK